VPQRNSRNGDHRHYLVLFAFLLFSSLNDLSHATNLANPVPSCPTARFKVQLPLISTHVPQAGIPKRASKLSFPGSHFNAYGNDRWGAMRQDEQWGRPRSSGWPGRSDGGWLLERSSYRGQHASELSQKSNLQRNCCDQDPHLLFIPPLASEKQRQMEIDKICHKHDAMRHLKVDSDTGVPSGYDHRSVTPACRWGMTTDRIAVASRRLEAASTLYCNPLVACGRNDDHGRNIKKMRKWHSIIRWSPPTTGNSNAITVPQTAERSPATTETCPKLHHASAAAYGRLIHSGSIPMKLQRVSFAHS